MMTRMNASAAALALLLGGCATAAKPSTNAADIGEIRAGSGYINGYLDRGELPNCRTV